RTPVSKLQGEVERPHLALLFFRGAETPARRLPYSGRRRRTGFGTDRNADRDPWPAGHEAPSSHARGPGACRGRVAGDVGRRLEGAAAAQGRVRPMAVP